MNKRFLQLLWAIPLLGVLSGCSENEWAENGKNPNNAIRLDVSAGKLTKAVVTDNDNVTNQHFGLYAYTTDGDWAAGTTHPTTASDPNITPDVMDDQDISYEKTAWTYRPLQYWPESDKKISFFGYWPKGQKLTDGTDVTKADATDPEKLPVITFNQEVSDPKTMVDFLVAHTLNKTRGNGVVPIPFKHALTRINFQARLDTDLGDETANTKVFVKGLKVLSASDKFYKKAAYQLADGGTTSDLKNGEWDYTTADKVAADLDCASIMAKATNLTVGGYNYPDAAVAVNSDGTNTDLLKQDAVAPETSEFLFLIPPTATGIAAEGDIKVKVDYDIVTVSKTTRTIPRSEEISLPVGILKENKAYNIIFTVGMDPIEVSADVTDWEAADAIGAPSADVTANTAQAIMDGLKVLNTNKGTTNPDSRYFVLNVTAGAPAGDLDLTSLNSDTDLGNFAMGDQIELNFNGQAYSGKVNVPTGWSYQKRSEGNGGKEHYVLVKSDGANIIKKTENANCYMVNMNGKLTYLTFPLEQATKGWNKIKEYDTGNTTDISAALNGGQLKTLWKTWSGSTSITGVINTDGTATVTIPKSVKNGNNAVVALTSEDGNTVYWSWHLWFTDYDPSKGTDLERKGQIHQYISDAFKAGGSYEKKYMMDRNLGATVTGVTGKINQPKTTAEAVMYYGLLYQFGRKDPFVGSRNGQADFMKKYDATGKEVPFATEAGGTTSRLAEAVQKPTTFYTVSSPNWSWTVDTKIDGLWGEDGTKSAFDPCPPGWRVPTGSGDNGDAKVNPWAGFSNSDGTSVKNIDFSKSGTEWSGFALKSTTVTGNAGRMYNDDTTQAWYPCSGFVNVYGTLLNVGAVGYWWSASPNGLQYAFSLGCSSSVVNPGASNGRADGFPVRCVQE